MVRSAHEHTVAKKELENAPQQTDSCRCDSLIGCSSRSRTVYDLIRRVCNLDAFVLITAESGTGKELVARAIHNLSHRAEHPFGEKILNSEKSRFLKLGPREKVEPWGHGNKSTVQNVRRPANFTTASPAIRSFLARLRDPAGLFKGSNALLNVTSAA